MSVRPGVRDVTELPSTTQLKRRIGLLDLTGFYVISALSLRWIATAAAVGPGAITLWVIAWAAFFVPLATCVLVLSRRFPEEGGLYVWTRHAFGEFAGFVAGWSYWMSNLPYFPAVLYFAAGSLAYARRGGSAAGLAESRSYYILFATGCLVLITGLNVLSLGWSKWLTNLGAVGVWIPLAALGLLASITAMKTGWATHITAASLVPATHFKDAVFWSTIAFAFGGCEAASFMGDEIQNPKKNIPRALFLGGALVTLGYVGGTLAMLVALTPDRLRGLGGFMLAIDRMCGPLGFAALVPALAVLVAISNVGAASAYLTSTARLPFVAGLDAHLPQAFGRIHPRFGTPYVAVLSYGAAGIVVALLSQAGTSVKGAYDVLVSMSVLTYFIPYVFLFAAVLKLEKSRRIGLRLLALVGLGTTLLTLALSAIPAEDDPNQVLTLWKTLGSTAAVVAIGAAVYGISMQKRRRHKHG